MISADVLYVIGASAATLIFVGIMAYVKYGKNGDTENLIVRDFTIEKPERLTDLFTDEELLS